MQKIRDRQTAEPTKSGTLQDLCANELAEKKNTATEGLVWLHRSVLCYFPPLLLYRPPTSNGQYSGLEFTGQALRKNASDPKEELSVSFNAAYGDTLKKHHNMLVKGAFGIAMKACPYRADFYKKLGNDENEVKEQLEQWLNGLESINDILSKYLGSLNWKV